MCVILLSVDGEIKQTVFPTALAGLGVRPDEWNIDPRAERRPAVFTSVGRPLLKFSSLFQAPQLSNGFFTASTKANELKIHHKKE